MKKPPTPTPGSPEGIELGCRCPRMDNHGGKGFGDPPMFWINGNCPLHAVKEEKK